MTQHLPARPASRVLGIVDAASVLLAGIVLAGMMFMTLIDVVGRYVLNAPLGFAFEMTQLGMAMVVFAALPSVTLRAAHVSAGLFEGLFGGKIAIFRDVLWSLVIAASCLFLAFRLSRLAGRFLRYGDETSVLKLPIGWIAWFGVAGLCLAALAALIVAVQSLKPGEDA